MAAGIVLVPGHYWVNPAARWPAGPGEGRLNYNFCPAYSGATLSRAIALRACLDAAAVSWNYVAAVSRYARPRTPEKKNSLTATKRPTSIQCI